ncbi:DUF6049 family protein [Microcella sp.]|uniref:DUF6049 family protein n=1 Tax=Microcella sp. TaxID=1913979 RepID=UPI002566B36E|nr:DUF6049 family protein [Microcella sp.]MBX9472133.1 hypothetical protein [Microcella sp.]
MSAVRERGGRRTPLRSVLGVAIALGLALPTVVDAGAPSAATVTEESAELEVLAAPSASGAVREGQPLTVRVTLSNDGEQATGPLDIELRLDGSRVAPADELAAWFEGGEDPAPLLDVGLIAARASIGALAPGASAVLDLSVAGSSALWGGAFGARLAEVLVADGDQLLAVDRTAVVRVPDGTTPGSAATVFVQPLTTPGETAGLLSAETLEALTAEAGVLSRTLSASAGRSVLLAIDPRVIASIRALGEAAPASALDFLDRLATAPNESFVLPWADADPLATIATADVVLPQPEGTGLVTGDQGVDETEATAEPSEAPADDPDESELMTQPVAGLIGVSATLDGVSWPGAEGFSAAALESAAAEGTRVVIAPSSVLESDDAVQRYQGTVLLRTDDALGIAARDAVRAPSQQQFDRAMARVSALLATSAARAPGAPAIIALDREVPRGADRLLDTLAQTISLPWSSAGSTAAAIARPAADAVIIDAPLGEARQMAVVAALDAETADRQFAQIALTPALITDVRRLELLSALSLGWGETSVEALRGFSAQSQALRASVQVVESVPILLLSDRSTLPVTVQNDLDVAVRVFVRVEPDTAQLRVLDSAVEATVEPRSQARVLVPVESLTNGEVDITVTVRDAQNRVLSEPTRVSLNLQAGWETAGVIIVAIAVALLFVVGIARDLRKRGRRAAEKADPDDDASLASESDLS